jgi:pilus assembly protein CpaF
METMVLMAGMDLPSRAIREQLASALHLIIQQSRLRDGSRRIIAISEVQNMEGDQILLEDLFRFERHGVDSQGRIIGEHVGCGVVPRCMELIEAEGIELNRDVFGAPRGEWR